MLRTRNITWVGYVKRILNEKEKNLETKMIEIPFKLEGSRTKYLLRITKKKRNKEIDYYYDLYEITNEYMGMIETFPQESYKNNTSVIMDILLQRKEVKKDVRWLKGWLSNFKKQKTLN